MLDLLPIIYPRFYIAHDASENELVLLNSGAPEIQGVLITDKTQCEAFVNHYHLFENIGKQNYENVVAIGHAIAKNLHNALTQAFPTKTFIVYLEVSLKDSVMLRFHQIWENEQPYFDTSQPYEGVEIFTVGTRQ